MRVKLDNLGEGPENSVMVTAENKEEAVNDQSIYGTHWEFDGNLAYAIILNDTDLAEELRSEGYDVDDSEYCPPDSL